MTLFPEGFSSSASLARLNWLADLSLKGCVILVLTALAVLTLRRASAAARHLVWTLGLVSLLALPPLAEVLPKWPTRWMPRQLARAPGPNPPAVSAAGGQRPMLLAASRLSPEAASQRLAQAPPARAGTPWAGCALAAWGAGALGVLGSWLAGVVALRRLQRHSPPLHAEGWMEPLQSSRAALGVRKLVRLLRCPAVGVPMTWGWRQPAVFVPAEAEAWPVEQRRAVLLHELGHVKRWDCLTHGLARLACALFWFNPLVWVAAWRMRVERERACDDLVLTAGAKACEYASQLLQIAARIAGRGFAGGAAIAMARRSTLEGRLLAILDAGRNRAALTRRSVVAAALLVGCVVAPVAMLRGGEEAGEAASRMRHFVRLVAGQAGLTLQGQPTTWEKLPELLVKVPEREHTVFELALESTDGTLAQRQRFQSQAAAIVQVFGFEYLSLVGVHPLGSVGSASQTIRQDQKIEKTDSAALASGRPRHFVRLVSDGENLTFEGQPTTLEKLPELLKQIPHRPQTVLELAVTSEDLPPEKSMKLKRQAIQLVLQFGLEYLSDVGVHPLGSKGTPSMNPDPARR